MKALRSYIREVLNEAYVNDKGELVDFKAKTEYPHRKIQKFIQDYIDTNYEDWAKMGWSVFDSYYDSNEYDSETGTFWRVERIDNPEDWDVPVLLNLKNDEEARQKAIEAGFSVNKEGIITGLWGINMVNSLDESKKPLKKVAGALIKDEESGDVLLIKRNDKTPRWAMVTGKIDEGEDPIDSIEREMYEELFVRPGQVRLNYKGLEHFPAQNIDLYYYEGFVKGKFKPHLDEENLDYGWFSIDELPSPLMGGLYNKIAQLDKNTVKYSDTKQVAEVRKQVRLIMESKIMPKFYLQEAVRIIKEEEEKSPTYHWDLTNKGIKDEPSPTYNWNLTDKGVKDDVSPTYHWDLTKDKPKLDSYEKAKEYIDKALSYIKDKSSALELIKNLKNYIQDLSTASKLKLTKYVATALLSVIGLNTLSNFMSNSSSNVEKEVISAIKAEKKKENVFKGYINKSSEGLVKHLKDYEGYRSTFYDLKDGAYTVGWGHAVFSDKSKGSTGGDYDFVPHFNQITPDVTMLLTPKELKYLNNKYSKNEQEEKLKEARAMAEVHAEELLRDDIAKAENKLNAILSAWESKGIYVNIDQDMYDAMISMVFNMGAGKKFRTSDFIQSVKRGDFDSAYNAIDKIDNPNLLKKFKGLIVRRAAEKEMFGRNLAIARPTPPPSDMG